MTKNVTLRVDEELLREARVLAAQRGTSLSGLLAQQLKELVRRGRDYERARQRALERLSCGQDLGWESVPRSQLYER